MSFTAGKLRVLIATTSGPVEIQLLTEEDAAIGRCVACIGGTTETADIASAYHAFVVRPTGVIEARFGHPCYRLDVSGRIDAGSSWQLGVLAAHALLAVGRLAQENDIADGILWVTGSVRPVDLTVGAVGHVPEKLANSLDRLKQELGAGRPVLLAVPAANAAEASPPATKELQELGAELVVVSHAQALFDRLGMKLPGAASKGSAAALSALAVPQETVSAKPRRRIYPWAVAAALIGIGAAGAVVVSGIPPTGLLSLQAGDTAAPPAPAPVPTPTAVSPPALTPAPAPAPVSTPASTAASTLPPAPISAPASTPPSEPASTPAPAPTTTIQPGARSIELVPETIPFIKSRDRQRVRDEYLPAPNYKALAMNMFESHFVSGMPNQEIADRTAVEECENTKRQPKTDTAVNEIEYRCELFASGAVVVSQRPSIPMPPMPWVNASVQRPFVADELPMASWDARDVAERRYPRIAKSKAAAVSPSGRYYVTSGESSPEEAMRRSLQRCGSVSKAACLVVAVDDTFVIAVPTLAKAVGFYRQDALPGVQTEERTAIARQLATSNEGWQAVALGAARHTGTKVGASSEQDAVDGALENCARYDHDCHVAVIGPFLVRASPDP